jgi:hypothetical protein
MEHASGVFHAMCMCVCHSYRLFHTIENPVCRGTYVYVSQGHVAWHSECGFALCHASVCVSMSVHVLK